MAGSANRHVPGEPNKKVRRGTIFLTYCLEWCNLPDKCWGVCPTFLEACEQAALQPDTCEHQAVKCQLYEMSGDRIVEFGERLRAVKTRRDGMLLRSGVDENFRISTS